MRKVYKNLTYEDRKIIEMMTEQGMSPKAIAAETGVALSTVYRELQRGRDDSGHYKADIAQQVLFL